MAIPIGRRDLKPGNIMITKSGVKLLDVGLAKIRTPGASPSPSQSIVVTLAPFAPDSRWIA